MIYKPCIICGELSETTRCVEHQLPKTSNRTIKTSETRWKNLSKRLRRDQPWCDICSTTKDLTVDHIIPISERPDLAYNIHNLRVLCRHHNSERQNNCTNQERALVLNRLGG